MYAYRCYGVKVKASKLSGAVLHLIGREGGSIFVDQSWKELKKNRPNPALLSQGKTTLKPGRSLVSPATMLTFFGSSPSKQ